MALFAWRPEARRFGLESVHPGHDADAVRAATGFDYDVPAAVATTPEPSVEDLRLLRGPVAARIAPDYPAFARRVWDAA